MVWLAQTAVIGLSCVQAILIILYIKFYLTSISKTSKRCFIPEAVTEALKTSNIKTVLSILRTIDTEEKR
jgi:hypothetical protein